VKNKKYVSTFLTSPFVCDLENIFEIGKLRLATNIRLLRLYFRWLRWSLSWSKGSRSPGNITP